MAENGPYYVEDGELKEREHAWDVTSNIIFVDSPINVGYSYSDDPRDRVYNESVLAADLLDFLQEFLAGVATFPQSGCAAAILAALASLRVKQPERGKTRLQTEG